MSDAKIMFKAHRYNSSIEPVEVVSCGKFFVTYVSRWGRSKESRETIFDTWENAHSYLVWRAEEDVASARRSLQLANSTLGNIKDMKKPEKAAQ